MNRAQLLNYSKKSFGRIPTLRESARELVMPVAKRTSTGSKQTRGQVKTLPLFTWQTPSLPKPSRPYLYTFLSGFRPGVTNEKTLRKWCKGCAPATPGWTLVSSLYSPHSGLPYKKQKQNSELCLHWIPPPGLTAFPQNPNLTHSAVFTEV